jgi:hypothetical protein
VQVNHSPITRVLMVGALSDVCYVKSFIILHWDHHGGKTQIIAYTVTHFHDSNDEEIGR